MDNKTILILTLITISLIHFSDGKSLYTDCGKPFNFCMAKKTPFNANVTGNDAYVSYHEGGGCIKDMDCTMIIHVTKSTSSDDVTIDIATVLSHLIYVGFKRTNILNLDAKGIPMEDYMMEVWDTGRDKQQAQTSRYDQQFRDTLRVQGGKGYGPVTINPAFTDEESEQEFVLYTFQTKTKPEGLGFDLTKDNLAMFYVRKYNNQKFYDNGVSVPRVILSPTGTTPVIQPTAATIGTTSGKSEPLTETTSKDGNETDEKKKSFPWWIILIMLVLLLLIAGLIYWCCCRKKSPPPAAANTSTTSTTSTTKSTVGTGSEARSSLGPVESTRPSSSLKERSQLPSAVVSRK